MKKLINKYRQLKPQPKAAISALISVIWNFILAVGKFVLSIFKGIFFLVSGVINIFFSVAKLECHFGLKNHDKESFKYRNIKVATCLLIAAIQYIIYMATLMFEKRLVMQYSDFLAINIALIAFVELAIAIKGMFSISGKGHYYRDIKLINLCSALTALMWAEVALLSFTTGMENMFVCGLSGVIVGMVIVVIAVYIYFAPRVSLIDRSHNTYVVKDGEDGLIDFTSNKNFSLTLSKSKVFGNYVFSAKQTDVGVEGNIIRTKNYWHKLNIWWKIFIILLSEILIFAYAVWAIVYFFKNLNLIKKLDEKMFELGYEKKKDLSVE